MSLELSQSSRIYSQTPAVRLILVNSSCFHRYVWVDNTQSHNSIVICLDFSTQGCSNIAAVASDSANITPYILLSEDDEQFQTFLVVDKTIVCEVEVLHDIPFVLMAAFFVFNICYPKGCNNLFSFMEILTLNYPSHSASATVRHFLSSLENI